MSADVIPVDMAPAMNLGIEVVESVTKTAWKHRDYVGDFDCTETAMAEGVPYGWLIGVTVVVGLEKTAKGHGLSTLGPW